MGRMMSRQKKIVLPQPSVPDVIGDITKDRLPDPILDGLSELHWNEVEASDPRKVSEI
jgi:hypothetical protein